MNKIHKLTIREEVSRCLLCHDAPCSKACPAKTDPAKFIRSLRFDNPKGAIETIKNNNILGGVCSKVCPSKAYCEKACSRTSINTPINIKMIQQYLMDLDKELSIQTYTKQENTGFNISIIGSGPAGLAAAVELIKKGHNVTIYEKEEKYGGYLTYGIPNDRINQTLVDHEINQVKNLGVNFKNLIEIKSTDELNTSHSVIWACGLHKGKTLHIEGIDLENVEIGVNYLRKIKENPNSVYKGNNVIVVGGGDVAMDVARIAKLRGANQVNILYRRTENDMPAYIDEKLHTKDCGVNIFVKFKPLSIKGNKKVEKAVFESIGNDSNLTLKCDQYIVAIGQECEKDISLLKDEQNGIFIAGDIDSKDKTVVCAIQSGKEAAYRADKYVKSLNMKGVKDNV